MNEKDVKSYILSLIRKEESTEALIQRLTMAGYVSSNIYIRLTNIHIERIEILQKISDKYEK